jgi:mannonate dehydratase
MDIALRLKIHELTDENLRFARQLGVNHILIPRLHLGNKGYFEFLDLLRLRKRVESYGLELVGIEQVAREYEDSILLGEPGRDEQIQNLCQTIRNMGKAGIPVLGYYFSIIGVWGHWRIGESGGGRGGAGLTSYDHELVEDAPLTPAGEVSSEEMWSRLGSSASLKPCQAHSVG